MILKITKSNYFKIFLTIVFSFIAIKVIIDYKTLIENIQKFTTILTPFIIGGILTFFLSYFIDFLETKLFIKRRWLSLIISYGLLFLIIGCFIFYLVPSITSNAMELVKDIPTYTSQSENFIRKNIDMSMFSDLSMIENIKEVIPSALNMFNDMLSNLLSTTISFGKFLVNFFLGFIVSIYILKDKEGFAVICKRLSNLIFGNKNTKILIGIGKEIKDNIGTYLIAKTLESLFIGTCSFIGYYMLGSKYSFLFGFIAGITNMIPFYGPVIGAIPVIIFNLFINIKITLYCLIFAIILQQIESNIIEPILIGNKMGMPPFLTLFAITIGGGLFGVIGMILAVPITTVIKNHILYYMDKKEPREQSSIGV